MLRNSLLVSGCLVLICGIVLTVLAQEMPTTAPNIAGTKPGKIRVLILDGFSNHNWKLNTRMLRAILEPSGLFDVSVSTIPPVTAADAAPWKPDFSHADVIIQTCNDIHQPHAPQWSEQVKRDFVSFVKGGGGVFIFHSANNAFPDWPEYNDIIGLGWRPASYGTALQMTEDGRITRIPAGQGKGTGHAARSDVLVHSLPNNPIHQGLPPLWMTPKLEVYAYARGPAANVEVLSYGQDPKSKEYWPLEWTVTYGEGRVYASSFGHVWGDESPTSQPVDLLAVDEQVLIMRALQWLAKRPVTVPVPQDFPTTQAVSVRPPLELPRE